MDVLVTLEHHFERTPDGRVWTRTKFAYSFWQRYLEAFDGVRVVSRVRDAPVPTEGAKQADGRGVSIINVPDYTGPWQYLMRARRVRTAACCAMRREDAFIFRVPSHLANLQESIVHRMEHPYGVEVVGDPYDLFSPGAFHNPLRPLFRWWFTRRMRQQCRRATAAAYITRVALQRRYPPRSGAYVSSFSEVELPEEAFAGEPRAAPPRTGPRLLVTVGSLGHLYKAPDVLLGAVAKSVRNGIDLHLTLVGDGMYRRSMEARAVALGLRGRVRFAGELPAGVAIRKELGQAHLFILPSRQEGLPSAIIEAMALGMPCIGSTRGGIPELLDGNDLVPPDDVDALASKIEEVLGDPSRMAAMARRNWEQARNFCEDKLRIPRLAFYRRLREETERWLRRTV
jgi:glycosyltransferase involved in cell wall biosynthesis